MRVLTEARQAESGMVVVESISAAYLVHVTAMATSSTAAILERMSAKVS